MLKKSTNYIPRKNSTINFFISFLTSMIGYQIHNSIFWAIMNFIFWPISWIKWIICHDVNLSIIKETFSWFLK